MARPKRKRESIAEANTGKGGADDTSPNGHANTSTPSVRPRRAAATKSAAATAAMASDDESSTDGSSSGSDGGGNDDNDNNDDILEKLFAPITDKELEEWQGWSEIESEPAFFNFILHELGVRGAAVQELFGVDEMSTSCLRGTPLGLIFLYKYVDEDEDEQREACPDSLWFANQTTDNACGTLAMLNIAMNCGGEGDEKGKGKEKGEGEGEGKGKEKEKEKEKEKGTAGLYLGEHLTRFKAATRDLHPALRGHMLSTDAAIRAKHNSFARRLDMLTVDLAIKAEWNAAASRKTKRRSTSRKNAKKSQADAAFHFIAYVPMGSDVWELNGMQEWPLKLGSFDGDWTTMARERIAARMQNYLDDTAVFSLLALCSTGTSSDPSDPSDLSGLSDPTPTDSHESPEVAAARKGDYTPAVYCWLKKLANKGVLRQLATGEPNEPGG